MEEFIICPKCQTENPKSSGECLNCGYSFKNIDFDNQDSNTSENWLDSLRKTGELKESGLEPENGELGLDGNDNESNSIPDWLQRIQEFSDNDIKKQDKSSTKPPAEDIGDELDNFASNLGASDHRDKEVDYEWLDEFRSKSEIHENQENEKPIISSEEGVNEESASQQPLLSINEIKKDWQKEFPSQNENLDEEEIPPAEDLPDWLTTDLVGINESEETSEDTIPTWLPSQPELPPEVEESSQNAQDANKLPTWLSNRGNESIESLEKSSSEDASLPEWLQDVNSTKNKIQSKSSDEESSDEIEDKETALDSELLFNKLEINIDSDSEEIQDEESDLFSPDSDFQPSELDKKTHTPAFILSEDDQISEEPFIGDEGSSLWDLQKSQFQSQQDTPQFEVNEEPDQEQIDSQTQNGPFTFDDIPDWLDKVDLNYSDMDPDVLTDGTEEPKDEITEPETASVDDISKGTLPEWLKALRPIEVVTPDTSKIKSYKKIENRGPLAGFRGVLSTENVSDAYTAPPTYSINVNITDKQRLHIKLLEGIVSPTNVTHLKTHDKRDSSLLSLLIPVAFLVVMIFSLFLEPKTFTIPADFPAETVRFHNLITGYLNQSQESGNILLISEVDSSAYPEINLISAGVLENIFLNNHWITTISTNPNGMLVSDNILNNASLKVPAYNFSERVINLGYLPGNYLGIQSFLANPKKTTPNDLNKQAVWSETHLSTVNSISDFDLFIMIADNTDNARLWIEQIELMNPEIGFLIISTTQSTPLLKPYVKSNQIDGMVGGIYGGFAFDLLSKTDTSEFNRYWSMNQISASIIIMFFIVGSIITIYTKIKQFIPDKKIK
jgi:hypothetical protein